MKEILVTDRIEKKSFITDMKGFSDYVKAHYLNKNVRYVQGVLDVLDNMMTIDIEKS